MRRSAAVILSALFALSLVGCDRATPSGGDAGQKVEGITQAEAQTMWDGLHDAFGEYDSSKPFFGQFDDNKSIVESATASSFDLQSMVDKAFQEDTRSRVLALNPDALESLTGTGDFASYVFADGGESGDDFPPSRDEFRTGIAEASNADIFHDAWLYWTSDWAEDADVSSDAEKPRLPDTYFQAYDVLTDALMMPALAATRTVSVEGTDTVLVTFRTRMTLDPSLTTQGDWTNRYKVEMRDGNWVITSVENLGDYAVAAVENDMKGLRDAAEAVKAKPSDVELKKHFTVSNIKWVGQDKQGRWWVASMFPENSDLQVRNAPDDWEWVSGSRDMGFFADLIPPEVATALKKAGLTVYE